MVEIVLKNEDIIKAYHVKLSKTGKSYMATTRINDCAITEPIPVNDIATIDGKKVEPYIPKSVKYNHSKWKVTKTWIRDGYI